MRRHSKFQRSFENLTNKQSITTFLQSYIRSKFVAGWTVDTKDTRVRIAIFRLDALALSVIATATWLAGCLSQPVLYQND